MSRPSRLAFLLLGGCLIHFSSFGEYMKADLEKIPIERLSQNLEELIKSRPDDPALQLNLARLHAMAYAVKATETEFQKEHPEHGAWFGYEPSHVPFKVTKAKDDAEQMAANAHLERAIAEYEKLLKIAPDNLTGMLGHAWCLEQAGRTEEAIVEYRVTIEKAWPVERRQRYAGPHSVVVEAGKYLMPLLDPVKDAKEVSEIKKRSTTLDNKPRAITPIVVPLADGLHVGSLEDERAEVLFDADGSGEARPWSWITPDAAWLVSAPNGRVTSALQMFGNVSWWLFWSNGYDALSALDDNHDGELAGAELNGLALWRDANSNGVSETGEVQPLSYYGIVSLSCRWSESPDHAARIPYSENGVRFSDGTTRGTYDIVLQRVK